LSVVWGHVWGQAEVEQDVLQPEDETVDEADELHSPMMLTPRDATNEEEEEEMEGGFHSDSGNDSIPLQTLSGNATAPSGEENS